MRTILSARCDCDRIVRITTGAHPIFLPPGMNPLLPLCIGMVIVGGGMLWLRLHPFLAMMAAAYSVAILTPTGPRHR